MKSDSTNGKRDRNASLRRKAWICVAAGALGAVVLAATPSTIVYAQTAALVQVDVKMVSLGWRASKLRGASVVNDKNERIGTIDDLIIDKQGKIFAVLQVGGFLGVGGQLVAVPFETLNVDDRGRRIVLPGATKDALRKLPEFKHADDGDQKSDQKSDQKRSK